MCDKSQKQKCHVYSANITATVANKKIFFILIFFVVFLTIILISLGYFVSSWIDTKIKNTVMYHSSQHLNNMIIMKPDEVLINENIKVFSHDTTIHSETELTFEEKLLKMTNCYDSSLEPTIEQHGNFWILSNYVRAEKQYRCFQSITYTTHGDYTFLDNIIPLVSRWKGPISIALHAPGTDFQPTIDSIAYLRNCKGSLVKKYVTFHILFDMGHPPTKTSKKPFDLPLRELYKDTFDCSKDAPYANVNYINLYKIETNISYPINVARNVAREKVQTHFVLASDIELYPSENLINQFLRMIVSKPYMFETEDPVVFALPVFEVLANESAPEIKKALQELVQNNRSFSFHKGICNRCHVIPQLEEWLNLDASEELDIFTTIKRQGKYERWEAVYIGTNEDPFFDETLDWERHGNKMVQAYALCLLNYDYMVLDNAFLVHKPGIKEKMVNAEVIPQTAQYIKEHLGVQFDKIYGKMKGCLA